MREREAGDGGPDDLAFSQLPHNIAKHTDRHHLTLIAYIFKGGLGRHPPPTNEFIRVGGGITRL